ncbi:hypothetical protein IT401_01630 [Candidatus Nomurabacteria bacterium]|nr:hypothetical protein [Candidatus Nomurabacteria bacterium]
MITPAHYAPQQTFLLQGDEQFFEQLVAHLSKDGMLVQTRALPRLTVEHADEIATFLSEGTGNARVQVVYFSVFSPEAAHVLLKSLEEPALLTTLLFVTRYPYLIPQTVRSRMMLFTSEREASEEESVATIVARIEKEAGEKEEKSDPAVRRDRALLLLDRLEEASRLQPSTAGVVYEAKRMLFRGNLPTKFVLDYIATTLTK